MIIALCMGFAFSITICYLQKL